MNTAKKKPANEPAHVDNFIWEVVPGAPAEQNYARWMLMHFRLPAVQRMQWDPFIAGRKLFCTYEGQRYRVTGASRMGDVWLAYDYGRETGYDHRVSVDACSHWAGEP